MPPAPLPKNEPERLAALLGCGVLDTAADDAFDDLTRLAARLCDTPIALVSLVDEHRQWFKSRVGLDATETPRSQAFCGYTILGDRPLVITDAARDPRTADNPLVTEQPGIGFYAGVPLRLDSGHALGSLCVIDVRPRDISPRQIDDLTALGLQAARQLELHRTIRLLDDATERANAANLAKSRFLANMSHEIRTPLTAVLGYADILAEDPAVADDPPRVREALGTIRRNGHHLLALINDILEVGRIESGRLDTERVRTDPAALAAEAAADLDHAARDAGTDLRIEYETPVPDAVESDPTRLRQVLVNLLANAVKFTERGRVTLRIAYHPPAALRFTVTDTGIGMSPDQLEAVRRFEPFTQADRGTRRLYGGTGLGLSISCRIAQALGGDLRIDSQRGEGTTVVFTTAAPVMPDANTSTVPRPTPDQRGPIAAAEPAEPARPLEGARVLLADDGIDNQRLLSFHLRRAGAEVTLAANGREAIDHIEAASIPFDLLVLDMNMPVLDGYAAAAELRERRRTIPIIALTAHAMAGDREVCLAAGCDDYHTKPIDAAEFVRVCSRLARPDAREEPRRRANPNAA